MERWQATREGHIGACTRGMLVSKYARIILMDVGFDVVCSFPKNLSGFTTKFFSCGMCCNNSVKLSPCGLVSVGIVYQQSP